MPKLIIASFILFLINSTSYAQNKNCASDELMEIRGVVELTSGCIYKSRVLITESNTHLDCKGAEFKGHSSQKIGILIDSKGKEINNISVRNCRVSGFDSSGVRVTWDRVDSKKGDDKENIYKKTPKDITLDNLYIENSGRVGVYVDDYVQNLTLKNSVVIGSGATGIYLEHSSRDISILDNKIINNGFGVNSKREGLAIDSSANNIISGNVFKSNNAGGIFLYKNCGEHIESGNQVLRWQHSDFNVISNNYFEDEKVGVWLASRQEKNLKGMRCGDPVLNDKGWYADYADNNKVEKNKFCRTKKEFIDKGQFNIISGSMQFCVLP